MRLRRTLSDLCGAFGDLGTLLPYAIGAVLVAGMAPAGVLLGFGALLIATGLFYAIPIAVQPMKAVGAAMLTGGLTPAEIAAAGLTVGVVILALGATGLIGRVARLVPQSVTAGLQLGLGLAMAVLGIRLMSDLPWLGFGALALLLLLLRLWGLAALPLAVAAAILAGLASGATALPETLHVGLVAPALIIPDWHDVLTAFGPAALPQLPLTVANAVILTAALSRALFPESAGRASERNLSLTTGIGNLVLVPFGALPMCHGAGGLQAQHRFGARTGLAPVFLGAVLLAIGLAVPDSAIAILGLIPLVGVGALLAVAGADLALSRRLFDARADCWPTIGTTAAVTLLVNPAVGLAAGWAIELGRSAAKRFLRARRTGR